MTANPQINLALQHSRAGNHAEAERVCRQIVQTDPSNALAWCHLGTCCLAQERLEESINAYQQAIRINPQFTEAVNNLGVANARLKRMDDAVRAFELAIAMRPNWAEPCISLGNLYVQYERLDDAAAAFRRAMVAEPKNAEAYVLLGGTIARLGNLPEARACFLEALRINPRNVTAQSNVLLALNYDTQVELPVLFMEHRWFDYLQGQGFSPVAPYRNTRDANRPLRVGYLSPDFRRHPVAWFMLPIFNAHDPKQVQIFAYVQQNEVDPITQQLQSRCAGWRKIVGVPDQQVAEQIRKDEIDILVDLAGHTGGNRLGVFTYRPAPIQMTYLGYPNTTGLSSVQYRITDAITDPPGERSFYSEELLRLPGTFCCFGEPENAPEVSAPPVEQNGFITFGLLHKLAKLNEKMIDAWAAIARNVPNSRLLIFRNTLDRSVQERLKEQFDARGVSADRLDLHFSPARDGSHLSMYGKIDMSLDSLPWSGHATTCESLWMGVPMVTLRGDRHAGRMSASILSAIGMQELIAESPEQFVEIAVRLANDTAKLANWRRELRTMLKQSPLCDGAQFTRGLESAYRGVWKRWCASAK